MRPRNPCRHTPHTLRGPRGSSTEGPSGGAHMRPRRPCQHTFHTFRDPGSRSPPPPPPLP
eukprot:2796392-Pyramimonas_sp.AAC.1